MANTTTPVHGFDLVARDTVEDRIITTSRTQVSDLPGLYRTEITDLAGRPMSGHTHGDDELDAVTAHVELASEVRAAREGLASGHAEIEALFAGGAR